MSTSNGAGLPWKAAIMNHRYRQRRSAQHAALAYAAARRESESPLGEQDQDGGIAVAIPNVADALGESEGHVGDALAEGPPTDKEEQ